jgi:hypothetical protein
MIDVLTTKKFSVKIEEIVRDKKLSYMDAIVWWCEEHEMEIETAAKLVNSLIKDKLKREAEDLNYLAKTARLPV